MQITIDTQKDTYEDIRKVLHILTHIIEKKESPVGLSSNYGSEQKESTDSTNLMSMFANPSQGSSGKENVPDTPPDFSNFMNLVDKKEEKKDVPKIQFF